MADCGADAHPHVKSCAFSMNPGDCPIGKDGICCQLYFIRCHFLLSARFDTYLIFRYLFWEDIRIQRSSQKAPKQSRGRLLAGHPRLHPASRGNSQFRGCLCLAAFLLKLFAQIQKAIEQDLQDLNIDITI